MRTVGQTVLAVSRQLTDQRRTHEYTRWSREVLMDYLNRGLKEISAYRPEAFARTFEMQLQKGRVQQAPDGAVVHSISTDEKGNMVHDADASLLKSFSAYSTCKATPQIVKGVLQYQLRSFSRDENDPSIFYVSPPVPAGVTAKVNVQVDSEPPEYTLGDWGVELAIKPKFYNNLITYMLACAYQMDAESQVSAAKSQRLFQLFYQTMGAKYKIDSARNSGYYMGEVGTGDPRSAT